ncbi:MAG: class II aldolase/adducin family protein [Clostridiales bacterium]|nr:class II aldolase/adducin family protein [Clostridiales bacterium]
MAYSESEARALVIEAGHRLLENKLIARTWGNISARVSDDEFVITPSGMAYDTLTPDKLVLVKIADLSYGGEIKPSSEKGIHAAAYALRSDVNFIIHTHQHYASVVCADECDTDFAPCAAYGLPGTKKLKKAMIACMTAHSDKYAFLMAHHGALCLGRDDSHAFALADELESDCRRLYELRASAGENAGETRPWLDDYAQIVGNGKDAITDDDAEAVAMIKQKNTDAAKYVRSGKPIGALDAWIQHFVYKKKYSKIKDRK